MVVPLDLSDSSSSHLTSEVPKPRVCEIKPKKVSQRKSEPKPRVKKSIVGCTKDHSGRDCGTTDACATNDQSNETQTQKSENGSNPSTPSFVSCIPLPPSTPVSRITIPSSPFLFSPFFPSTARFHTPDPPTEPSCPYPFTSSADFHLFAHGFPDAVPQLTRKRTQRRSRSLDSRPLFPVKHQEQLSTNNFKRTVERTAEKCSNVEQFEDSEKELKKVQHQIDRTQQSPLKSPAKKIHVLSALDEKQKPS